MKGNKPMDIQTDYKNGIKIFRALDSETRLKIIEMLLKKDGMSLNELANALHISNSTLTAHIKKLEEGGLITITTGDGTHGSKKCCSVAVNKLTINFFNMKPDTEMYQTELKVGQYSRCEVTPTCGLATPYRLVGYIDDPRYFNHPDRFHADILWFTKGYVEYIIPNLIPGKEKVREISISLELSSEAPGTNNDWPSDISFFMDEIPVGTYLSPGDFGDVAGGLTPEWWNPIWNQYGLLKTLTINDTGTYIDGVYLSDVKIDDLGFDQKKELRFRLSVEEHGDRAGGLTIFGRNFGNYSQDIVVCVRHSM